MTRVLVALARNQSPHGHIPSLVNDPDDRGASDTTPLFLLAVAVYRLAVGDPAFLHDATQKALTWMRYQSPPDRVMVGQLPTSDWRDEQWVLGFGLYVNAVYYTALRLLGDDMRADKLKKQMTRLSVRPDRRQRHVHEGLRMRSKPYYALWSYKMYSSERFDLLGNSLAILSGIASASRAEKLASWIEDECEHMKARSELAVDLAPNLFPFVKPVDPDWRERYSTYNQPGDYHNGGIWPFVSGFHIAALVAAGRRRLAEKKLIALTKLIKKANNHDVSFGFNEWYKAQTGMPGGQDWQTWSAALYLYAARCVEKGTTPFFDFARRNNAAG
jgi:hypothetical protein